MKKLDLCPEEGEFVLERQHCTSAPNFPLPPTLFTKKLDKVVTFWRKYKMIGKSQGFYSIYLLIEQIFIECCVPDPGLCDWDASVSNTLSDPTFLGIAF